METKQEIKEEVILLAKIDKDGKLIVEVPKDMRMTGFLLLHLNAYVSATHMANMTAAAARESAFKPKIIA